MARLTEAGHVVALEGDTDGAITGLIGKLLGLGPGYISDWLEHDDRRITLWHPGHAPFSLCEPIGTEHGPRLGVHFNNRRTAVVNARLLPDEPITIARLWRCDGHYRLTAFEAHTRQPQRALLGAHGVAETDAIAPAEAFEHLCHAGMPHHLTVWPGHHAGLLRRFARHLGLDWVPPTG
jgi:L-fucose isomerase-like protein